VPGARADPAAGVAGAGDYGHDAAGEEAPVAAELRIAIRTRVRSWWLPCPSGPQSQPSERNLPVPCWILPMRSEGKKGRAQAVAGMLSRVHIWRATTRRLSLCGAPRPWVSSFRKRARSTTADWSVGVCGARQQTWRQQRVRARLRWCALVRRSTASSRPRFTKVVSFRPALKYRACRPCRAGRECVQGFRSVRIDMWALLLQARAMALPTCSRPS
jgi:hypothetical protein